MFFGLFCVLVRSLLFPFCSRAARVWVMAGPVPQRADRSRKAKRIRYTSPHTPVGLWLGIGSYFLVRAWLLSLLLLLFMHYFKINCGHDGACVRSWWCLFSLCLCLRECVWLLASRACRPCLFVQKLFPLFIISRVHPSPI